MNASPEALAGVYRVALSAACMAHGLDAADAEQVHQHLSAETYAHTIEGVYDQILAAIHHVRSERNAAR